MSTAQLLKSATQSQTDMVTQVAQSVENMTQEQAWAAVETLDGDITMNSFRLGGALSIIRLNKWWGEYPTLKDLVEQRFGFTYRKSVYLADTYDNILERDLPWEPMAHLGFTKIRHIATVATKDTLAYWISQAESMTASDLESVIKQSLKAQKAPGAVGEGEDSGETITSTVVNKSFKFHVDQWEVVSEAIERSKQENSTEYSTVALERIALGYLTGAISSPAEPKDPLVALREALVAVGDETTVLTIMMEVFPSLELVSEA